MKKITSFEQYKTLLKTARKKTDSFFSNHYSDAYGINRYINIGRLYYYDTDGGIILLFDEERYYKAHLYLDSSKNFDLPFLDKKILIRNAFHENKKTDILYGVEKKLSLLGFNHTGTTVQVISDTSLGYERCLKLERHVKKMEQAGYKCIYVDDVNMKYEIDELLINSGIIKDYHVDYHTPEEKKTLCSYFAILSPDGELCGGNANYNNHGISQGIGVVVKDKYKMYGIAPMLAYYSIKRKLESNLNHTIAWILIDNTQSRAFHESIGWKCTDKYVDEWIREPN